MSLLGKAPWASTFQSPRQSCPPRSLLCWRWIRLQSVKLTDFCFPLGLLALLLTSEFIGSTKWHKHHPSFPCSPYLRRSPRRSTDNNECQCVCEAIAEQTHRTSLLPVRFPRGHRKYGEHQKLGGCLTFYCRAATIVYSL